MITFVLSFLFLCSAREGQDNDRVRTKIPGGVKDEASAAGRPVSVIRPGRF